MTMRNDLEIYRNAGRKAGKAARQRDIGMLNSYANSFRQWLSLEAECDRAEARKAYDEGYRETSGFQHRPENFK